ncbi:MAG: hypothetical protein KC609_17025, partial [Myxococcales bacterium]|nr:hypothetical protein [Myxococcales bacterium]
AHVSGGEFDRIVRALRQDALVRPSESVATALEVYHERVASAVHRQLLDDERRSMHAALAAALERGAQVDQPDALLFHLARAGERERAAALAKLAASRATEAGAYDKAVELYRQAIDLADLDRSAMRPLRLALAEALVRAGRGPEAAASFLDAFDGADAQTQLYCGSQAAEQYLISGHIDQGMAAIEMLLAHVGTSLPETPRRALFSLLGCRLRLRLRGWVWRERPLSEIPRNDLLKIDVYRAVSRGLTMVDTVRGADFTARHALLALQLGEVNRVARALAVEAMHLASQGALERARSLAVDVERLVERGDAPDLPLWAMVAKSGVSYFSGEFGQTAELLEQAEEMYQSVMATHWEVNNIRLFRIFSLKFTGRWGDVRRLFGLYVRDAQRRGDRYMEMTLKRHCVFLELAADRPDEGRRWLDEATWSPPAGQFHLQHWFELEARTEVALYKGPDDQAVRRLLEGLAGVERSLLDRVQIIRVSARKLQAQLLLSAAVRTRSRAKLNEVERLASALERERVTYARVFASLIRAGIAAIELDNPKVLYHLRRTIALCEPVGMGLYANVARRLVAGLELSPSSEAEVARIEEQFRAEGVQSPQRLLALLAPGVAALLTHEGGES